MSTKHNARNGTILVAAVVLLALAIGGWLLGRSPLPPGGLSFTPTPAVATATMIVPPTEVPTIPAPLPSEVATAPAPLPTAAVLAATWAGPTPTDDADLVKIIGDLLAAGCGVIISWLYQLWLDARQGSEPPKIWQRFFMIVCNIVIPLILYGGGALLGLWPWDPVQAIAYIGIAFIANQSTHGVVSLRTGTTPPAGGG
jgi:hypothetical protein